MPGTWILDSCPQSVQRPAAIHAVKEGHAWSRADNCHAARPGCTARKSDAVKRRPCLVHGYATADIRSVGVKRRPCLVHGYATADIGSVGVKWRPRLARGYTTTHAQPYAYESSPKPLPVFMAAPFAGLFPVFRVAPFAGLAAVVLVLRRSACYVSWRPAAGR